MLKAGIQGKAYHKRPAVRILLILLFAVMLFWGDMLHLLINEVVDRRRLEAFAGTELPSKTRLGFTQDAGGGFLSSEESVRIYWIDEDEEWVNEKGCDRNGFSKTEVVDMKVRIAASAETGTPHLPGNAKTSDWELSIPVLKRNVFLMNDLPVCYKYRAKYDGVRREYEEAVFIQRRDVIHYWSASEPE